MTLLTTVEEPAPVNLRSTPWNGESARLNRAAVYDSDGSRAAQWRALLIEPDEACRVVMATCIRLAGSSATWVESAETAFSILERQSFDLVVWGVSGNETRHRIEIVGEPRLRSESSLIVVDGSVEVAQQLLEAGADKWVAKPFSFRGPGRLDPGGTQKVQPLDPASGGKDGEKQAVAQPVLAKKTAGKVERLHLLPQPVDVGPQLLCGVITGPPAQPQDL